MNARALKRAVSLVRLRYGRGAVIVAVVVVAVLFYVQPFGEKTHRPAPTAAAPDTKDVEGSDTIFEAGKPAPPAEQARTAARLFAVAWARPDLPADQWWDGVARQSEPGLAAALRDTIPENVPARNVTGPPKTVRSTTQLAVFEVPTDAGTLVLTTGLVEGKWRVTDQDWRPAR